MSWVLNHFSSATTMGESTTSLRRILWLLATMEWLKTETRTMEGTPVVRHVSTDTSRNRYERNGRCIEPEAWLLSRHIRRKPSSSLEHQSAHQAPYLHRPRPNMSSFTVSRDLVDWERVSAETICSKSEDSNHGAQLYILRRAPTQLSPRAIGLAATCLRITTRTALTFSKSSASTPLPRCTKPTATEVEQLLYPRKGAQTRSPRSANCGRNA